MRKVNISYALEIHPRAKEHHHKFLIKEEPLDYDDHIYDYSEPYSDNFTIDNSQVKCEVKTEVSSNLTKKFRCEHCEKYFTRAHHLRRHIASIHEGHKKDKTKKYDNGQVECKVEINENHENHPCDFCGKVFFHLKALNKHVAHAHKEQNTIGDNENELEMYGENNSKSSEVQKIKTPKKSPVIHECSHCKKTLSSKVYLQKHINTVHLGIKDYACDLCGQTFTNNQGLKGHIARIHEERRDHQCKVCDKAFGYKFMLKEHILSVHENVKPICNFCGKAFNGASRLRKHIKKLHDEEGNHKCELCGKGFKCAEYLKYHIEYVHEGKRRHQDKSNDSWKDKIPRML